MFSVGNPVYLVRTMKYQPKAQAAFFIWNDKLEAGKACSYAANFYISI